MIRPVLINICRASTRIEHFGFVCIAGIDVFHIEWALWFISVMLLLFGALAFWRDVREWQHDAEVADRAERARQRKIDACASIEQDY